MDLVHADTTSDPIARRAINTAKMAFRNSEDIVAAVTEALDAINQPTMYWREDDSEGVRIGDFYGKLDLIAYRDNREPVLVTTESYFRSLGRDLPERVVQRYREQS